MDSQILKQKLNDSKAFFTDDEIRWLIENIGNPKSEIRDDLVCNTFGSGFLEGKFTEQQVLFLIKQLEEKNLLFYRIKENGKATLTRSFACLLWDLIIKTNNDPSSKYYQILDKDNEKKVFESLIHYLSCEHDFTGFSKEYGWVHAIAHCSDALADSILSDNFDQEVVRNFLSSTRNMLNNVDRRFIDGEEYRLADVFVIGFKEGKINSQELVNWIKSFALNPYSGDLLEYYRFNNLKSLLEDVYVKLNSEIKEMVENEFSDKY